MASWHGVDLRIGFNGFGKIDPYIDWAFGTPPPVKRFHHDDDLFPILLCLRDGIGVDQFANGEFFKNAPQRWKSVVRVAQLYRGQGDGLMGCRYFTALVKKSFFDFFDPKSEGSSSEIANTLRSTITRMAVSRELLDGTYQPDRNDARQEPGEVGTPSSDPENETVVMGIIDDGLAFANARFRTATDGTRVEHIWFQDGEYHASAARYGYGCSLSKYDVDGLPGIDSLLRSSTYGGIVDEDEFYARVGAVTFELQRDTRGPVFRTAALRASHGTHVMDVACGYPPGSAPRNERTKGDDSRPIVCVQLPAATSEGTSGASLDTSVVDGIRYILDKADEIARRRGCGRLPVVINFSYGTLAGRHDGTSDIERAVDEVICARRGTSAPVQVIIPAGNSRLNRGHAKVSFKRRATFFKKGSVEHLHWRVLPDDRTTSHLEIWLPRGAPANRIKVSITPPGGSASPLLVEAPRPIRVWGETVRSGVCEARYCHVPQPTNRGMFLVSLKPTARTGERGRQLDSDAPAGLWTIRLENVSLGPEEIVDAWIQRDDTRYGHLTFGRQSYFDHADYVARGEDGKVPKQDDPKCLVKRKGTLNGIATGAHSIVIGGFRRSDFLPVDYSGEGRVASRVGPDALAVSDETAVHSGVLGAGTRSGSVVALTGTSVAAPQIARMVACLLAKKEPAHRDAIRHLAEKEERDPGDGRPQCLPEERGGKGRFNRLPVVPLKRVE